MHLNLAKTSNVFTRLEARGGGGGGGGGAFY